MRASLCMHFGGCRSVAPVDQPYPLSARDSTAGQRWRVHIWRQYTARSWSTCGTARCVRTAQRGLQTRRSEAELCSALHHSLASCHAPDQCTSFDCSSPCGRVPPLPIIIGPHNTRHTSHVMRQHDVSTWHAALMPCPHADGIALDDEGGEGSSHSQHRSAHGTIDLSAHDDDGEDSADGKRARRASCVVSQPAGGKCAGLLCPPPSPGHSQHTPVNVCKLSLPPSLPFCHRGTTRRCSVSANGVSAQQMSSSQ